MLAIATRVAAVILFLIGDYCAVPSHVLPLLNGVEHEEQSGDDDDVV
jgi:hypothetical protein